MSTRILILILTAALASILALSCAKQESLPLPPGAQVPNAPSNLTASDITENSVKLTWRDRSDNEDSFDIERSDGDQSNFQEVDHTGPDEVSKIVAGLRPRSTYYFRVSAYNRAVVNPEYSNVVSATTLDTLPAAPSGLRAQAVSSSSIALEWQDNSDNEQGFIVTRSGTQSGVYLEVARTDSGANSLVDSTGLMPLRTYWYKVKAFNGRGFSSESNTASAQTLDNPPFAPILRGSAISARQIDLNWTPSSENHTSFYLERKQAGQNWIRFPNLDASLRTYSDTGLTPQTQYDYHLHAVNAQRRFSRVKHSLGSNPGTASAVTDRAGRPSRLSNPNHRDLDQPGRRCYRLGSGAQEGYG